MTRDKNELEAMVRARFPLVFSMQDPIEAKAYAARRNALIDYATAVSAPWLSTETVRYQTMLLASTLIFLSFGFLKVSSFKIADVLIALDARAFLLYGLFLFGVAMIFTFKASVDYDRAGLSRTRNAEAISEIQYLIEVGLLSEKVEQHFYRRLEHAISAAHRVYSEKLPASISNSSDIIFVSPLVALDLAVMQETPELVGAIDRHEVWLTEVCANLDADMKQLIDKVDKALLTDRLEAEKVNEPFLALRQAPSAIHAAYAETLAPWMDMQRELASKGLVMALGQLQRSFYNGKLAEINNVLQKVVRIRRWTFRFEVILPLIFTTGVILLVAWQPVSHSVPKPPPPVTAAPSGK